MCVHRTSPAFVDAVAEVLAPLFRGVPLVLPARLRDARDARALAALLDECRVTRLTTCPTQLSVRARWRVRRGNAS